MKAFILLFLISIAFTTCKHYEGNYFKDNMYTTGTTTAVPTTSSTNTVNELTPLFPVTVGETEKVEKSEQETLPSATKEVKSLVFLDNQSEFGGLEDHLKGIDRPTLEAYALTA